jgi:hypothetical protein
MESKRSKNESSMEWNGMGWSGPRPAGHDCCRSFRSFHANGTRIPLMARRQDQHDDCRCWKTTNAAVYECGHVIRHSSSRRGFGFNKIDRPTGRSKPSVNDRSRLSGHGQQLPYWTFLLLSDRRVAKDDTAILAIAAISCRRRVPMDTGRIDRHGHGRPSSCVRVFCAMANGGKKDQPHDNGRWIDSLV